jgi:hypothetical protein
MSHPGNFYRNILSQVCVSLRYCNTATHLLAELI